MCVFVCVMHAHHNSLNFLFRPLIVTVFVLFLILPIFLACACMRSFFFHVNEFKAWRGIAQMSVLIHI